MTNRRPTNLNDMQAVSALFCSAEGWEKGLSFAPAPTDIIITPYAKCGTTWMQQIVHGLRTGGAMEFEEISDVVPWIELAHDMGLDIKAAQVATPRAFKSHLGWSEVPKGGRYIVVYRDPLDAMVSLYRFLEDWFFEAGSVSLEEFAEYYLNRPENDGYWGHTSSWWAQSQNPDVLMFTFERMKRDLPGVVAQVAPFIGINADDALLQIATKQAGFEFMKQHGDQFDDHLLREARDPACGLPSGGQATKVSKGRVGGGKDQLSDAVHARFNAKWSDTMERTHGLASYSDLAALADGR